MAAQRRRYSPEFKLEAARMVVDQGHSVSEVAERLGIHRNLLQGWKKKYEAEGPQAFTGEGRVRPDDQELRDLKRELARVRQERDILKKALAYFANEKR